MIKPGRTRTRASSRRRTSASPKTPATRTFRRRATGRARANGSAGARARSRDASAAGKRDAKERNESSSMCLSSTNSPTSANAAVAFEHRHRPVQVADRHVELPREHGHGLAGVLGDDGGEIVGELGELLRCPSRPLPAQRRHSRLRLVMHRDSHAATRGSTAPVNSYSQPAIQQRQRRRRLDIHQRTRRELDDPDHRQVGCPRRVAHRHGRPLLSGATGPPYPRPRTPLRSGCP